MRIRQQSGYYKEYLVDQLQFQFEVDSQKCLIVIRPRKVNGHQAGLVDTNSPLLNFKKAIFGEESFKKFRHQFETSLMELYEVPPRYSAGSVSDIQELLEANKPPLNQIPAMFSRQLN